MKCGWKEKENLADPQSIRKHSGDQSQIFNLEDLERLEYLFLIERLYRFIKIFITDAREEIRTKALLFHFRSCYLVSGVRRPAFEF